MPDFHTLIEEIDTALFSHLAWKHRLRRAAITKEIGISVQEVASVSCCRFGQWLVSLKHEEQKPYYFERVKNLHTEFHEKAGPIAQMIANGETEMALEALNSADYNLKSKELASALMEWKARS